MKENGSIRDRILEFVSAKGYTLNKFAKIIGVPQPSLSGMVQKQTEPSSKTIVAIASTFRDIDLYWLILGEGEMYREKEIAPIQIDARGISGHHNANINSTFNESDDKIVSMVERILDRGDLNQDNITLALTLLNKIR